MIINITSVEEVSKDKYKIKAVEGEFYSKTNGHAPGPYQVETKEMKLAGSDQVVKVITEIKSAQAEKPKTEKAATKSYGGDEDKMSKGDWAAKDRNMYKMAIMDHVLLSPGLSMVAATKDENNIGDMYVNVWKKMLKAFDDAK